MSDTNAKIAAGADGCRGKWLVVMGPRVGAVDVFLASDFQELLERTAAASSIMVDMPIGLDEVARRGGRSADVAARKLLPGQTSSIFPAPPRAILGCQTYAEARRVCRESSPDGISISAQAFMIASKIAEIDRLLTPESQQRVVEVHPELAFRARNGGVQLPRKKTPEGLKRRRELLDGSLCRALDRAALALPKRDWGADDLLDAAVAFLVAHDHAQGKARRVPEAPEVDARGLRMEMWY